MRETIRGRSVLAIALSASLLFAAACDRGDDDVDEFAADTLATPAATPTPGTMVDDLPTTDAGIVDLVMRIDRSEIETTQLARDKAQNQEVKSFANQLHQAHTQDLQRMQQLGLGSDTQGVGTRPPGATDTLGTAGRATTATPGTTPQQTPPQTGVPAPPAPGTPGAPGGVGTGGVSMLGTMHEQTMSRLQSASGAEFDRAFIDSQVSGHQHALSLLQQVQGRVQEQRLRQQLTQTISTVQQHLQRAQQLQTTVGTGGTTGDTARAPR